MAQTIKQANIFGRVGTSIGEGLAEHLPKEIDRGRLAAGLSNFEQEHGNLNPMQQLARLSAIPGITPQTLHEFSELAKINNQRNAYGRGKPPGEPSKEGGAPPPASANIRNAQEANILDQMSRAGLPMPNKQGTQQAPSNSANPPMGGARSQPRVANQEERIPSENTVNPASLSRLPWTPKQRDNRISNYIDQGFLPAQAEAKAADDERRYIAEAPAVEQRQQQEMKRNADSREELNRQLDTKLQKTGDARYKDLIGEMYSNVERGMMRALRTDPFLSIEDAANEWSNKALNTAKAKTKFDTLAATTGIEALFKGKEVNSKLDDYSDAFRDSGNSEEYYNMLKRKQDDPNGAGLGLSSEGAATKAFPMNPQWDSYVENYNPRHMKQTKYGEIVDPKRAEANARKAANEIAKTIQENDSVLTIGRALRKKDPYFDQESFYDEMRHLKDNGKFSDRQKNELPERNTDWFPTWGDFLILPWGNIR